MNLVRKVQEIRERYQPPDSSQQEEIHLHWQALVGSTRIRSQDDLDQCSAICAIYRTELEQQKMCN